MICISATAIMRRGITSLGFAALLHREAMADFEKGLNVGKNFDTNSGGQKIKVPESMLPR